MIKILVFFSSLLENRSIYQKIKFSVHARENIWNENLGKDTKENLSKYIIAIFKGFLALLHTVLIDWVHSCFKEAHRIN